MHDRFTDSGRRAVVRAKEEARSLGHKCIGTEHLLLGLLREQTEAVVKLLEALDVEPDRVRERVILTVGCGMDRGDHQRPVTPRARKALELALEEALSVEHDYVAGEHILLGLLREPKGVAAQVLYRLGANLEEVRSEAAPLTGDREKSAGGGGRAEGLPRTTTLRARVKGLAVQARCGVTDEERATPQPLRVDLDYFYEAREGDDLSNTVDYGTIIEGVAGLLERGEFQLLETGARMVGEHVLDEFPPVREVTVAVTKLRVPIEREVSAVSVEATFSQ